MKPIRLGLTRDQRAYLALSKARKHLARGEQQTKDARAARIQASRALLEVKKLVELVDQAGLHVRGALINRIDLVHELEAYTKVGR